MSKLKTKLKAKLNAKLMTNKVAWAAWVVLMGFAPLALKVDGAWAEERSRAQQVEAQVIKLSRYQEQMKVQIAKQAHLLERMDLTVEAVAQLNRQLLPLLEQMTEGLSQFIESDLPFQKTERLLRVQRLKENLLNPHLDIAEKYRQLLGVYQSEIEYGRTLQRFHDIVEIEGERYSVDQLKVGRVALLCQTKGGRLSARWDVASQQWQWLEARHYRQQVDKGLKMLQQQAPAALLTLPIAVEAVL